MAAPGLPEYREAMDMTVGRRDKPPGSTGPWSPRAWGQAATLAGGIPLRLVPWFFPFLMLWRVGPGQWPTSQWFLAALACLVLALLLIPVLTRAECSRLRAVGVDLPPGRLRRWRWPSQEELAATLRDPATWRQVVYHLVIGPAVALAAGATLIFWLGGLAYAAVYLYGWGLPEASLIRRATFPRGPAYLPHLAGVVPFGLLLTVAGLAALFAAPRLTVGLVSLDAQLGRSLLGPSRAEELTHRVEQLTETRAGVVDAADAERRRLERDLHDGTQQRLVSLAMNLGLARARAETAEDAQHAIADAHEEAKAALAELRDLIRGLHPAVLEDRGLDAALSGVAARMPIPVRLTVDLPRRPAPVIEAVAYFVVSEGLSNIVKHAQATQAEVFVQRAGDRLHVIVTDDGSGGADPTRGTGLSGLARRAASVDGTFEISSPVGGPTLLTVDLPCSR
jgi:signal transduction histidine kinase